VILKNDVEDVAHELFVGEPVLHLGREHDQLLTSRAIAKEGAFR